MVRIRMFVALTVGALSCGPALAHGVNGRVLWDPDLTPGVHNPPGHNVPFEEFGDYTLDDRGLIISFWDGTQACFAPMPELKNIQPDDLQDLMNKLLATKFRSSYYNPNTNALYCYGWVRFTRFDSNANKVYMTLTRDGDVNDLHVILKLDP